MLKMRIAVEQLVARKTVTALLDAGYCITVDDGEEKVLRNSRDLGAVLRAMFSTDEDVLYVDKDDNVEGDAHDHFVKFIYGNSGWDVINDYSTKLDDVLKPVNELTDLVDAGGYTLEVVPTEGAWNKP